MPIVSLAFLGFIVLCATVYFLVPKRVQPYWLLAASIFFYLCYDVRYMFYLGLSIVTTFLAARGMDKVSKRSKKWLLLATLLVNIGMLIAVKYTRYTVSLFSRLFSVQPPVISLLVPLGIAFYTLQAVGYCVDVYRGKYPAERNIFKYTLFMSYFPIIMQGPISRYDQLANQLFQPHSLEYRRVKFGVQLMLWGFFKKLVIADRAAILVNQVFDNYTQYTGTTLLIASFFYTIQIYTDFSGCVDICRGVSQVLGIDIIHNFDRPYFAVSIQDFWRRWHISLSNWLRDYVYIPLGGNRKGLRRKYINILLVFLVSGLWHGVGIHYIVWGCMHGVYQILGAVTKPFKMKVCDKLHVNQTAFSYKLGQQIITFFLVNTAWIFFRANGTLAALKMLKAMVLTTDFVPLVNGSLFQLGLTGRDFIVFFIAVDALLIASILQSKFSVREKLAEQNLWFRWTVYLLGIFAVLIFGIYGPGFDSSAFIYMQF